MPISYKFNNHQVLKISGSDCVSFLHGQLITDIKNLPVKSFIQTARVDISGRIEFVGYLKKEVDFFYLVLDMSIAIEAKNLLESFIVMEDVAISHVESRIYFNESSSGPFEGFFANRCGSLDFTAKNELISEEEVLALLFHSGQGVFAKNIFKQDLLVETPLLNISYSLTKGCFRGQESISKVVNNLGPNFVLCFLTGTQEQLREKYKDKLRWYHQGLAQVRMSRKEREAQSLKPTIKSKENLAQDYYLQAIKCHNEEDFNRAENYFAWSYFMNDRSEDTVSSYTFFLDQIGQTQKAYDIGLKFIEKVNKSVLIYSNLSIFALRLGDKDAAEKFKSESIGLNMTGSLKVNENLERKKMFEEIIEIDSQDQFALKELSEIYYESREFEKSLECLDALIRLGQENIHHFVKMAEIFKVLEMKSSEKEVLNKAIGLIAESRDVHLEKKLRDRLSVL